jgi:SAM-dependent methyltransferase
MGSLNRIVMQQTSRDWIRALGPRSLDVAEISGKWGESFAFRSYQTFRYPQHDPCAALFRDDEGRPLKFDLILANQVWEHVDRPHAATRNVWKMLRKGGWFWLAVPFFIPYHAVPVDCTRWSARGLRNLLIEGGFDEASIKSAQWGNRAAALRNLETPWPPEHRPDDDLTDDPDFPIVAWAMGQKL